MSGTSASTDPNIPLQAGQGVQQPQNPLATIGQFAQVRSALNQNALFPLQQQQMQLANQRSSIGAQSDQSALIQQQRQLGGAALTPLLAKKGPITLDDVTTAFGGAEKSGVVTQPALQDFMAIPITGNPAIDDASIRAHILALSQPPQAAAGAVTPQEGTVDAGNAIQPVTIGARGMPNQGQMTPAGGAFTRGIPPQMLGTGGNVVPLINGQVAGPAIPTTPTPDSQNQLERVWNAKTGQYDLVPRSQVAPMANGAGQQTSPLGNGRIPTSILGPNSQPPAAAAGPGPAQEAQLRTKGDTSEQAFQGIASEGVAARGQNSILGTMLADTSNFSPGPAKINDLKATMQRYAPGLASAFNIDPNSVAANESFDKLANQIANAQGAGSDARLGVIQHANPSSQLSPAGVDGIIRQLQGNADYLQARAKLAATYPDQTDRAGFEAKVGSNLDPRAFQFARMTPQQRSDYYGSLKSDTDKSALKSSYNWAVQQGLIGGSGG